ncbi:unnamed protein product [Dovyalis caffra]|uniref:Alpha/beta hydrolase fold-3 domain-containing protein n=1 Tax=Dovyalis caffra TaxID=77055 RepID=A0AAV1S485_9ROSI|nr:unnamed protein product [Dovyalis caffra]
MPSKSPDHLPWRIKLFVSTLSYAVDFTRRSDGSINRRLMSWFDPRTSPSPSKPINGGKSMDITVDKTRNIWFRLYNPTTTTTTTADDNDMPVIFYFHGGGFSYFAPSSKPFDDFCYNLARELQAVIISVNYRLAPEYRYPCQYEDCLDAMKFIDDTKLEEIPSEANLRQCFLAGDSAGGNLAHHVAVRASEYEFSNIKLIGFMAIQPYFGGEERTESEIKLEGAPFITTKRTDLVWRTFLPEGSNRDHQASNVFGPNAVDISRLDRFPPTIVFVGGFDPLQDWQKSYYEGLKKSGKEAFLIEYPNAIHSFYAFPELPEFSLFMKEVKGFMQNRIHGAN